MLMVDARRVRVHKVRHVRDVNATAVIILFINMTRGHCMHARYWQITFYLQRDRRRAFD